MRACVLTTLAFATAISASSELRGQDVTGSLIVTVTDSATGQPLRGAEVEARHSRMRRSSSALSDESGTARLPSVPVGDYSVTIRLIGYRGLVVDQVVIGLGHTSTVSVGLTPTPIALDPLVITATRGLDFTSTEVVSSVRSGAFRELPIERDFQSVLPLLAHANATYLPDGLAVAGSTGMENAWHIDGVNVTDPVRPQLSTRLPYNFVQEVRLRAGGYEAEFGRALGGLVDVVTASGGDDFGSEVFGFVAPSVLAGTPTPVFLGAEPGAATSYDFGGSVHGPIVRERLRFLAAYNVSVDRSTEQVPGFAPERALRTTHMFAGKLSWQVDDRSVLELSAFGDPSAANEVGNPAASSFYGLPTTLLNPDPFLREVKDGGYATILRGESRPASWLLLEGSAARYHRLFTDRGRTEIGSTQPLFVDLVSGEWSGGVGEVLDEWRTRRHSAKGAATAFLGPHTVKGGLEFDRDLFVLVGGTAYVTRADEVGFIERVNDTTFVGFTEYRDKEVSDRIVHAYLQDSWQATDWLVVNAGLRWATQSYIGVGDTIAQSFSTQWQPRLGLVVALGRRHKLSASAGRYYLQLPLLLTMNSHGKGTVVSCEHAWRQDPRNPPIVNAPTFCFSSAVEPRREGVEGEHADEVVVGYEGRLPGGLDFATRGIYRALREAWGAGFDTSAGAFRLGNLGRGELAFLPRPTRRHAALEFTVLRRSSSPLSFLASYVLSRTHGNYSGIYSSGDGEDFPPQLNVALELAEQASNSTGLLPNDRTHVFKAAGSYGFRHGLSVGAFFTAQSGIPLTDLGQSSLGFGRPVFLVERGSAGRTPAVWDLDLRISYQWPTGLLPGRGRIILDLRNVGSPRTAVLLEQYKFLDPANSVLNPTFGQAKAYQPPMSLRLGLEIGL